MSNLARQSVDAEHYAAHVEDCMRRDVIPMPPSTVAKLLVITEEYPHLLAAYLPFALSDTPFRRALVELVADVPDWP